MGQYDLLSTITDPNTQRAVKLMMDRLSTLEKSALKIGTVSAPLTAHLQAGNQQIKALADPTAPTDAVTLQYLQKWVEGRLQPTAAAVQANTATLAAQPAAPQPAPTPPAGGDNPVIPNPVVTPPPPTPPPSQPIAAAGDMIPMASVTIVNSPDVSGWAVTAAMQSLTINSSGFSPVFSKQNGSGSWPDIVPPGWQGPLQFTLWVVAKVAGVWYASGVIQFWRGLATSGGPPSKMAVNWFYSSRWGALFNKQPAVGELVGFFVTAGNERQGALNTLVNERSNIVQVAYPADSGASYQFT